MDLKKRKYSLLKNFFNMRYKVSYISEPFEQVGGCQIQLLSWQKKLNNKKFLINLSSDLRYTNLLHFFPILDPSYFCLISQRLKIPYIVSTNYWSTDNWKTKIKVLASKLPDKFLVQNSLKIFSKRKFLYKNAVLNIANTNSEKNKLVNEFNLNPDKIVVIPNTIDSKFFSITENNLKPKEIYILTIASVDRRKNMHLVAKIAADLKIKYKFYGPIMDSEYFSEIITLGKGYAEYGGVLKNASKDMLEVIDNCSVYVLPSTWETPGLSAMQAAARNKPLLVTMIGGSYEYFGDYALYNNGNDISINKIKYLLDNGEKHVKKYKKDFKNNFSSQVAINKLSDLYENIIKGDHV